MSDDPSPPMNRREALAATVAVGAAVPTISRQEPADANSTQELSPDERFVIEAGMTRAEAECWRLTAAAAGAFFRLPELHSMDEVEVSQAIHVIQNKLLARPTYRRYLALAKAARGEDPE